MFIFDHQQVYSRTATICGYVGARAPGYHKISLQRGIHLIPLITLVTILTILLQHSIYFKVHWCLATLYANI